MRVDLVAIDLVRVDLVATDPVRVDMVAIDPVRDLMAIDLANIERKLF